MFPLAVFWGWRGGLDDWIRGMVLVLANPGVDVKGGERYG